MKRRIPAALHGQTEALRRDLRVQSMAFYIAKLRQVADGEGRTASRVVAGYAREQLRFSSIEQALCIVECRYDSRIYAFVAGDGGKLDALKTALRAHIEAAGSPAG